jgi:hypothetical protein
MKHISLLALGALVCWCGATLAQTTPPTQRIRGDVIALDGKNLQVKSRSGETLAIKLADNYAVSAVVPIDRSAIQPGVFIGAATMPQPDGTLSALEVVVFPEAARGSGEGHYAWDLKPGSMMTNATITNVAVVTGAGDRRMTVKYKDGEKTILVPDAVPVVTFEPGEQALLVPGAHVLLTATRQPDGGLSAARVLVGKNGLVPPM